MNTAKISVIFLYKFRRHTNTAPIIGNVYEADTTKNTLRFWFAKFRSGLFNQANEAWDDIT